MADKKISELVSASDLGSNDLLVVEQNSTAKSVSGAVMKSIMTSQAKAYVDNRPRIVSVAVTETDNAVTIRYVLSDGNIVVDELTFDANGYVTGINANGASAAVSWEVS